MNRRTAATVVAVFAGAGLLAGCSSSPQPAAATTPTTTSSPTKPSTTAAPPASPKPGAVHTLNASGVTLTVQVAGYTTMTLAADNGEDVPGGTPIGLVSARVCITANTSTQGVALDWDAWTVLTAAGTSAQALTSDSAADFPSALYDNDPDTAVPTGDCRAGLIPFSLKGLGAPVVTVEYSAQGTLAQWSVG